VACRRVSRPDSPPRTASSSRSRGRSASGHGGLLIGLGPFEVMAEAQLRYLAGCRTWTARREGLARREQRELALVRAFSSALASGFRTGSRLGALDRPEVHVERLEPALVLRQPGEIPSYPCARSASTPLRQRGQARKCLVLHVLGPSAYSSRFGPVAEHVPGKLRSSSPDRLERVDLVHGSSRGSQWLARLVGL